MSTKNKSTFFCFAILTLLFCNAPFANAQAKTAPLPPDIVRIDLDTIVTFDPVTFEQTMCTVLDTVYNKVDTPPVFCTDDAHQSCGEKYMFEYLATHVKYPLEARENKIQGKVLVEFDVLYTAGLDGSTYEPRIKSSPSPILSEAALTVVREMKFWKAAQRKGKPVSVVFVVPVIFKLD